MLVGKSFVVEPDIFLRYPRNRPFVAGEQERPYSFRWLWLAVGISAVIDCVLLLLGLGVLPVELPESLQEMQWLFLVFGIIGIVGTIFMVGIFSRLQNGQLLEGRVTEADVRPSPSRPSQNVQYIKIEFRNPDGQMEATVITRPLSYELPKVGTQAAVMYGGKNRVQVL